MILTGVLVLIRWLGEASAIGICFNVWEKKIWLQTGMPVRDIFT